MLDQAKGVLGYLADALPLSVLGSDPFEIERLVGRISCEGFGRAGELVTTAIALIDTACWDREVSLYDNHGY